MSKSLKVHLGAFDKGVAGWVNTDITPHLWIGRVPLLPHLLYGIGLLSSDRFAQHRRGDFSKLRYVDISRPLPFADASVEFFLARTFWSIFSSTRSSG